MMFKKSNKRRYVSFILIFVLSAAFMHTSNVSASDEPISELISEGKPASASYSIDPINHGPDRINDGNLFTYWDGVRGDNGIGWVQVDLLSSYTVTKINIVNYFGDTRYYKYFITVSMDGDNWIEVGRKDDESLSTQSGVDFDIDNIKARYVRINMIYNSVDLYSVHINEVRVYGYKADKDAVEDDLAALEIGYAEGDSAESVTDNINLPTRGICGSDITWTSSHPDVVSPKGVVNGRKNEDVLVTLTATIKKGSEERTKEFTLTVKGILPISQGKPITASYTEPGSDPGYANDGNKDTYWGGILGGETGTAWLQVDLEGLYKISEVNVRNFVDGTRYYNYYVSVSADGVTWTEIGANNGTEPARDEGDTFYTDIIARYVKVTLTKNSVDPYSVHVSEFRVYGTESDEMCVSLDTEELEIVYANRDSSERVTSRLVLPGKGKYGSTITWESDRADIISNDGSLNTSGMQSDTIDVNLTATISKGEAVAVKNFKVTVVKPISQGKETTASFALNDHDVFYAVDGDPATYWDGVRSDDGTAWLQVDLGDVYRIDEINIINYYNGIRYYKYYIKVSIDGKDWIPVAVKNSSSISTDSGDSYDLNTIARYVRVYTTECSVSQYSVHISELKVFGEKYEMPSSDTISINSFMLDKKAYYKGDVVKASYSIKNNSDSDVTIKNVVLRKYGLTDRMNYSENTVASDIVIGAGQEYTADNVTLLEIPGDCENGAYGFWLNIELSKGEIYDRYCDFIRVVDESTLLTYDVNAFDYHGLTVYALDGGMSAEATVEKSLENLDSTVSHSWYIQSNGGPNFVYSSESFLEDSINKTVDLYNTYLGKYTPFDTVILATGNCGINYLSRVAKAPVLPVQFLITVDTYKELRDVIDRATEAGIDCYSTLGHDLSMKKGVAWVKLLDLPQAYKDFLVQHNVKNVVIAATSNSVGGESLAKKVIEESTELEGTNPGDIYIMYPNGYTDQGKALDIAELSKCLKDYKEINLESEYRDFSDWESGMIQTQVEMMANSAINTIGSEATVIQIAADGAQALYNYGSYAVCKFYQKNLVYMNENPIKGIVMNPYLIGHPAYETVKGFVPALFWQGHFNGEQIVQYIVEDQIGQAIHEYFPDIDLKELKYWINYTNNFGGAIQANEVKQALIRKGIPSENIIENDLTQNEVWDPSDGMDSPVEKIAIDIVENLSVQFMKDWYSNMSSLNIQDLIDIVEDITKSGMVVTYKIFSEDEGSISDEEDVAADAEVLEIIYAKGDSADSVTQNVILPATGERGSTISWISSNPEVISDTGAVNRPSKQDVAVTLKAIISKGDAKTEKEFTLTVKRKWISSGGTIIVTDNGSKDQTVEEQIVIPDIVPDNDIPVKVDVSEEILNKENGTVEVVADITSLNNAFQTSSVVLIEIPKTPEMKTYIVTLPLNALTDGKKEQVIKIETGFGTLVVPTNMLYQADMGEARNVSISVGIYDTEGLDGKLQEQIGNRPAVRINITAEGTPIQWSNADVPVKVSIPYTPAEEELADIEHIVVWHIDEKGKAVPVPTGRYNPAAGAVEFVTTQLGEYAIAYVKKTFDDIAGYEWAKEEIEAMASKGIIKGISETEFNPSAYITRADLVVMLVRALGLSCSVEDNFADVNPTAYYAEAVGIAKKLGITVGDGNNRFNPQEPITRQDMMTMIRRAMEVAGKKLEAGTNEDLDKFNDKTNVATYAVQSVADLIRNGIVKGTGNNINPLDYATRAEAVVIIYRVYNK